MRHFEEDLLNISCIFFVIDRIKGNSLALSVHDFHFFCNLKAVIFILHLNAMRKLTLLLILCCTFLTAKSEFLRGYVITLDGKYISGTIQQINSSKYSVAVAFTNDYGTSYNYHPALIRGFVYMKGNDRHVYESHYHRGQWLFLQQLYVGEEISLFKYPDIQVNWVMEGRQINAYSANQRVFWLKQETEALFLLRRNNFRSKFTNLINEKAPELAEKIGKRGYRYKDLEKILEEYDTILNSSIKKI